MKKFFKENGLSVVIFSLFLIFWAGQSVTGYYEYQSDQKQHGSQEEISFSQYFKTGHFLESTFENWESEFLQMGLYVILTTFLFQKGSSESKSLDESDKVDEDPSKKKNDPNAPWPVRKGGWALSLYKYSLSLVLMAIFILSFFLHAVGGAKEYENEQREHGKMEPVTVASYLKTSRFWFESFQNWQSEFLAVGSLIVFSIFLRQQGSPQSKPVAAPHSETGD